MQDLSAIWIGIGAFLLGGMAVGVIALAFRNRGAAVRRRESQHRFDRTQELAQVGYWTCDLGYDQALFSDGVASLLGLAEADAPGNGGQYQNYVHEEDRSLLLATRDEATRNSRDYSIRYRIRRADGETRHVEERGTFIPGPDGRPTRIEGCLQDVTELKKSEEARQASNRQLQSFIEHTPLTIVFKDCDGRCVLANSSWHALFNAQGLNVIGKVLTDMMSKDLGSVLAEQDHIVIEEGRVVEREVTIDQADRPARRMLLQKFPVRGNSGEIIGVGTIGTDLTESYRANEALRGAKEAAEIANRTKSEFLANMSHELRTPLNAVIGFSEILQNQLFGPIEQPQYQEYIDDINASARHLLEILNDILDMSKVESGEYMLDDEIFPCQDELNRCLRLIREKAMRQGLQVNLSEREAGLKLQADRRVFKQILLNLLSNALKFTPKGGKVTVSLGRNEKGELAIEVIDTGIGIAEEDMERVLQPFGQADSSLSRKVEGTGLGLSLVQRFMQLHEGRLELISSLNEGTTARILFPKGRVSYDAAEAGTVSEAAV